MLKRHKHRWRVIDKEVLKSPMQVAMEQGFVDFNAKGDMGTMVDFMRQGAIVHYRCVDCPVEKVVRI